MINSNHYQTNHQYHKKHAQKLKILSSNNKIKFTKTDLKTSLRNSLDEQFNEILAERERKKEYEKNHELNFDDQPTPALSGG